MSDLAANILLVEDDAGIARVVKEGLEAYGVVIRWARSGESAIAIIRDYTFSAILLDIMLPDGDGFQICKEIRAQKISTPILILTARDTLNDKLQGFEHGADDYITKPFAVEELYARINAICRRQKNHLDANNITFRSLRVQLAAREAYIGKAKLDLTRREFDVLLALTRRAEQVVSREDLLRQSWGDNQLVNLNTVDVYVSYLRKKLVAVDSDVELKTIRGVGFKLC